MEKIVSIDNLIEAFELEVLNAKEGIIKEIVLAEVHRPGTELTGYIMGIVTGKQIGRAHV